AWSLLPSCWPLPPSRKVRQHPRPRAELTQSRISAIFAPPRKRRGFFVLGHKGSNIGNFWYFTIQAVAEARKRRIKERGYPVFWPTLLEGCILEKQVTGPPWAKRIEEGKKGPKREKHPF
ncbi:MAG: hypothetical protein V4599_10515, partial [Verrucomicrobiota bacterium]